MGNENKVRTFQQSRQLQRAKGASRGFYPIPMLKGKKGKGKGKGKKGKGFHHQASSPSTTSAKPLFSPPGMDRSSTTSGTGCFICGRARARLPRLSSPGTTSSWWWKRIQEGHVLGGQTITNTDGFGALDLGATETVGRLEALETLMAMLSSSWTCQAGGSLLWPIFSEAVSLWEWWSATFKQLCACASEVGRSSWTLHD